MKNILITGGAGYIGSHVAVSLIENGYNPIILDNLSNSSAEVIYRIKKITGKKPLFIKGDICDKELLNATFKDIKIDSVMHFAGLKAVGESAQKPLKYFKNNVGGSINIFDVMKEHRVKNLVFSSSATVYGDQPTLPYNEEMLLKPPSSPYGETKLAIENILRSWFASDNSLSISILRYFNPIGAHKSGYIGENPRGIPNNLMPFICQAAAKKLKTLEIYGNNYKTRDGTGVRDYIHVLDLASGHLEALKKCFADSGIHTYNLGTGKGISVMEMVNKFQEVNDVSISYEFVDRRKGDLAEFYADSSKIKRELGWVSKYTLEDMCKDSWNWQNKNPNGLN
ncbi:UDP-glucose 4-epimerase GalE [Gammaproteobacteria bacterium]|nr:UDP-glucose 4-epimerase GalE [Gammaproteobacteria bacterium]